MPLVACPSRTDLSGFNLGRLPEQSLEEIAAHIEQCNRCEEAVKELDHEADPIVKFTARYLPSGRAGGRSCRAVAVAVPVSAITNCSPSWVAARWESSTWRGTCELLRVVALKMLLGGEFARDQIRARFNLEARAVARLQHPNIVQIFEVGEWYVSAVGPAGAVFHSRVRRGGSLSARLAGAPQAPFRAANWILDVGSCRSLRPRSGYRSSRSQAFERVVDLRWPTQDLRFRRRQTTDGVGGRDAGRPLDRDAGIHGSGASRRRGSARSAGVGRLRTGRDPVHDAHGSAGVSGGVGLRDP